MNSSASRSLHLRLLTMDVRRKYVWVVTRNASLPTHSAREVLIITEFCLDLLCFWPVQIPALPYYLLPILSHCMQVRLLLIIMRILSYIGRKRAFVLGRKVALRCRLPGCYGNGALGTRSRAGAGRLLPQTSPLAPRYPVWGIITLYRNRKTVIFG